GSPPSRRAAYAAAISAVNGPTDHPSNAMWCTTKTNTYSSTPLRNNRTRHGTSPAKSKPPPTNCATAASTPAGPTSTGSTTTGTAPTSSTRCAGTPSTAGYTVRNTSWRATTSPIAAPNAATSNPPQIRNAAGITYAAEPGSNRFKNHNRC